MRFFYSLLLIPLLLATTGTARAALIYDFSSPAAAGLNGLVQGVFTVDTVPLTVSAGTLDQAGAFALGGSNATMFVGTVSVFGQPPATGLGVNSDIGSGAAEEEPLNRQEGLVFDFDSAFRPAWLTVVHLGVFIGELRLFADGAFLMDVGTAQGTNSIALPSTVSQLAITPRLGGGVSSDPVYLVSSIAAVPEPATVTLFVAGLLALLVCARRRRKTA